MKKLKFVFIVSVTILFVAAVIVLHILAPQYRDSVMMLALGFLLCYGAVCIMIDSYHCKTKTSAVLINYGFAQFKAHVTSSPIFTYHYQGKTYTQSCTEALSQRYALKHYKEGETYDIYVSVKNPLCIKLTRRPRMFELMMFIMGLCIVALSGYSMFLAA